MSAEMQNNSLRSAFGPLKKWTGRPWTSECQLVHCAALQSGDQKDVLLFRMAEPRAPPSLIVALISQIAEPGHIVPETGPRSRPAVAHELPLPAASARLLDNRFQMG